MRGRPLSRPRTPPSSGRASSACSELAGRLPAREPPPAPRELARHLGGATCAAEQRWRGARAAAADRERERDSTRDGCELEATLQLLREELLEGVGRIGGRLGELRLDTDLDISHGVVRYLELLKLSALVQRPRRPEPRGGARRRQRAPARGRHPAAARDPPDLHARRDAARPSPGRDGAPPRAARLGAARGALARALPAAQGRRPGAVGLGHPDLPQLPAALQVRARPADPHRADASTSASGSSSTRCSSATTPTAARRSTQMLELLDAGWRRSGFGESERERELHEKARDGAHVATTRGWRARTPSRCGSSARSPSGSGPTTCAGASTASTACADGAERARTS